jgi:hypothetical protein
LVEAVALVICAREILGLNLGWSLSIQQVVLVVSLNPSSQMPRQYRSLGPPLFWGLYDFV